MTHIKSMTRLVLACLFLVVVTSAVKPGSAGEATRETARRSLLEAFVKSQAVNRAWRVSDAGNSLDGLQRVEIFREGSLAGISAFVKDDSVLGGVVETRLLTDGTYIVALSSAGGGAVVTPGSNWLNTQADAWAAVREALAQRVGFQMPVPARWHTEIGLGISQDGSGLELYLDAVSGTSTQAGWLRGDRFDQGTIKVESGLVWRTGSRGRTSYRRTDGTVDSIQCLAETGATLFELESTTPARSLGRWRSLLKEAMQRVQGSSPDSWTMQLTIREYSRLMGQGFRDSPETLRKPNRVRTVVDMGLSVLLGGDSIDNLLRAKATADPGADPDRLADGVARRVFGDVWAAVASELARAGVSDSDAESIRTCVWGSIASRLQTSALLWIAQAKGSSK